MWGVRGRKDFGAGRFLILEIFGVFGKKFALGFGNSTTKKSPILTGSNGTL
jgi:hypothetical protein